MSLQSLDTDVSSSTLIDDSMSVTVNDFSGSTVSSRTSSSWHSFASDTYTQTNQPIHLHSVNKWIKTCSIEPDIRLTTAQEWKLRNATRRLISIFNLPLRISLVKSNNDKQSLHLNQEKQQIISRVGLSSITLIDHPWLTQGHDNGKLQQLALYLCIMSTVTVSVGSIEAKLFEYHTNNIVRIPLTKPIKLMFHLASNMLKLSLRSLNSLLELHFSTRESELIRGRYFKWKNSEYNIFNVIVDIDHNLIHQFRSE